MNLEDLTLETQISELNRLQSGCLKAREAIQRIQSLSNQLDDQATRVKAEFEISHATKTQRLIERVESEAKKRFEQNADQTTNQYQATRAERAEQIKALNAQLKQDIADCQRQLHSKLGELRTTGADAKTLLDVEPQEVAFTNEISQDLPEFDLPEPETEVVKPVVSRPHVERSEIDRQVSDLEQKVRDTIQKRFGPKSKVFDSLPPANVAKSSAESEVGSVAEHINLALAAIDQFSTKKPPFWGRGLSLLILGAMLFCAGTVASAVLKIDLGSLMSFDLSEADFSWLGISCGIGLTLSFIVAFVLRKLAGRGLKLAMQDMLLHTANAKALAEQVERHSEPEFIAPVEAFAPLEERVPAEEIVPVESKVPAENIAPPLTLASKDLLEDRIIQESGGKQNNSQREAEIYAAADEQIDALIRRHAEQIEQYFVQFEDQFLQFNSESSAAKSTVETWRDKELSRIQNHSATSLEQAFSKLAQDVQAKREKLSTEAATTLSRWKSNLLIASEVARISAGRASQLPASKQICSQGWIVTSSLPPTLTAGTLQLTMPVAPETMDGNSDAVADIQLPGLLNFPRDASMAIEHDADGREPALDFVRAVALQLLTSIAPRQLQFTLIAPVSPEQSFSGLTQLAKYNEQLIDGQVWSDSSQIESALRKVSERMDRVLKAFLDSGANSLDEHNAMSADSKEPFHFVVIAGFPRDFTDEAASLLTSILNGGALCGVHVIVMWSSDLALPKTFKTRTLQKNCTLFQVKNGAVQAGNSLTAGNSNEARDLVQFTAVKSPDLNEYEAVISAVGSQLQPMALVNSAVIEERTQFDETGPSEPLVESSNRVDAVLKSAVELPAESYSPEQRIFASSTATEPVFIDNPVSETPSSDNPTFEWAVTESAVSEPAAMVQGIAAIPVTADAENDPSRFTDTGPESPVVIVPVVETLAPAMTVADVATEVVATKEATVEEAVVLENSIVNNESADQPTTPEFVTAAALPMMEHCVPLKEKLAQELFDSNADGVPVWIGESSNSATVNQKLLRARGQNTLIVGQNEVLADEVFASTILSLCAGRASSHAGSPKVILVHDGLNQESLQKFAVSFSDAVTPRFAIRSAAGVDAVVAELLEEMNIREKNRAAKDAPEIVLAVRNIGQFPTLRRDYQTAGNESSQSAPAAPRFGDLLRQGPRVGIHVMMWADTFENAMQCLSNSLLRECDTRIAFKMNSEDSISLISSSNAATIDEDTAILHSEQTGSAHLFRPFAWPSAEWLVTLPQTTTAVPDEPSVANEASVSDETTSAGDASVASETIIADGATVTGDATETPHQGIISTSSTAEHLETSDSDGFTLAADVVATEIPVQPTSESSPGNFATGSSDVSSTIDAAFPQSSEDLNTGAATEKSIGGSKPDPALAKSKSAKGTRKPATALPASPDFEIDVPSIAKTLPSNVVASAKTVAQKADQSPSEKKVSGMALRMSSRNSDALRPLDAPPEQQTQVVMNEPAPETAFDEMDFNSLLIE